VATGPEYGFSLFYLVPIALAAWALGRGPGVAVAIAAGTAWIGADLGDRLPDTRLASTWNGFTRLVIFTSIALLLSVIRGEAEYLWRLDSYRSELLGLLADEFPQRLQRLARSIARLTDRPGASTREIQDGIEELVAISRNVVTLGLMPVPADRRRRTDLAPLVREAVRGLTGAERVVIADPLRPVSVGVEAKVMALAVASLVAALLRTTTEHVTVIVRAGPASAEIELRATGSGADLAPALETAPDLSRGGLLAIADLVLGVQLARAVVRANGGDVVPLRAEGAQRLLVTLPIAR
jgi:hypothetical protein